MANILKSLTAATVMVMLLAGCNPCDDSHHWVGQDGQCELNDVGNSPSPSGSSGIAPAGPATISASLLSPAANATGVDVGAVISLQISEPLTEVSSCMNCQINGLQFAVTASNDPTQTQIPGSIQISGSNIAFVPRSPLNLATDYTVNFSLANADVVVTSTSWSFATEQFVPNPTLALSMSNQTLEPLALAFYQKVSQSQTSVVLWQVVNLQSGAGSFITPDSNYTAAVSATVGGVLQTSGSVSLMNGGDSWTVSQDSISGALTLNEQQGNNPGQWMFLNNTNLNVSVAISLNGNQVLASHSAGSFNTLVLVEPNPSAFYAALVPAGSLPGTVMTESQLPSEMPINIGQSAVVTGSAQTGFAITVQ